MPTPAQLKAANDFAVEYFLAHDKGGYPDWLKLDRPGGRVALGQWAVETGWGGSNLFRAHRAAFGIQHTANSRSIGPVGPENTASYRTVRDSVSDYLDLMVRRNSQRAEGLARATSPRAYLSVLQQPPAYNPNASYADTVERVAADIPVGTVDYAPWWWYVVLGLGAFVLFRVARSFFPSKKS